MSQSKNSHPQKLHKPDLPPFQHVTSLESWRSCMQQLRSQPRVALDLEANSMYAYQEQICLIQISVPGQDYIVDPLAALDLEGLGELVADPSVEKVFHAAEYDLMLMKREYGWELNNLFDTMWAARILGVHRIGLANILAEHYQLRVNKRFQRANWCRRPLSEEQLAYAQADTHYLLALRDYFAQELAAAGRMEEAEEIFIEQSRVDLPSTEFDPNDFWNINGVRGLSGEGKAILKELNIYRDQEAKYRDRPAFKILSNRSLVEIARRRPVNEGELSRIHGMSRGQMRRYGEGILRIVKEKQGAKAPPRPRRKPRPAEEVMNRYERLRAWRRDRGVDRGVESDVIVSRDTLWELAYANPKNVEELREINGLGDWRRQEYGEEILQLLER